MSLLLLALTEAHAHYLFQPGYSRDELGVEWLDVAEAEQRCDADESCSGPQASSNHTQTSSNHTAPSLRSFRHEHLMT